MATLELIDRITTNLATRQKYLSVFMDLSKAFDTIDHTILLRKLHLYGFSPSAVNLIKSYLTDRTQFVTYKGTPSDLHEIKLGIPQGSIMGPLLFIIYINDINRCSNILEAILYADDSTFSVCLDTLDIPVEGDKQPDYGRVVSIELDMVSQWLVTNSMCLNVQKTKFMIFNKTIAILTFL